MPARKRCRPVRSRGGWGLLLSGAFLTLILPTGIALAAPGTMGKLRAVTLDDLVETRTIDSISVSPDVTRVAFRVLRPSIREDRVEAIWYQVALDDPKRLRRLGRTGAPRWLPVFDAAIEERPVWAAGDTGIMVLGLSSSGVQVRLLGPGGVERDLTHDPADVERFALVSDGSHLEYWIRNSRSAIAAADTLDARHGLHFDRTIITEGLSLQRNILDGATWTTVRRMDDRTYRSANSGDLRRKLIALPRQLRVVPAGGAARPAAIDLGQGNASDHRLPFGSATLGLVPMDGNASRTMPRFGIAIFDGSETVRCDDPRCVGTAIELRLLAAGLGAEVYFLREDQGSARSRLYTWNPRQQRVRLVLDAAASLDNGSIASGRSCAIAGARLICVRAAPDEAPALVAVELANGRVTTLFDPNPTLRDRAYPQTRYIEWRDRFGRTTTGVLALPEHPRKRLPLVITTYRCRGFLRGGVARLAPEFPLVADGFAVLCANSNPENNDLPPEIAGDNVLKMHKADIEGYRAAIDMLSDQEIIDRDRVGIAGHSYSANVISYAVSHMSLFRAAVIGSGISIDSATWWVTAPAADAWRRRDVLDLVNLPRPMDDPTGIWKKTAPSLNAGAIHTAILFQPPQNEYLMATQLYAAIQESGGATDMYVYPDAGHEMARFPLQLLMRSRRSLDWFSFWLKDDAERGRIGEAYPAWHALLAAPNGPFSGAR